LHTRTLVSEMDLVKEHIIWNVSIPTLKGSPHAGSYCVFLELTIDHYALIAYCCAQAHPREVVVDSLAGYLRNVSGWTA
jgi:hypothetical protein